MGTGPAEGDAVTIIADDTSFEPTALKLTSGETITVKVTNEGRAVHDFAIDELDLNTGTIERRADPTFLGFYVKPRVVRDETPVDHMGKMPL